MYKAIYQGRPSIEENQGTVTEEDAALLFGLALCIRPKVIVEVGTGWFRSLRTFVDAQEFLRTNHEWETEVWSCDINSTVVDKAEAMFPTAHCLCCDSSELARRTSGIELAFIDGEHTYDAVMADYLALRPSAADTCVWVFHDTGVNEEVKSAAIEIGAMILPAPRGIAVKVTGG